MTPEERERWNERKCKEDEMWRKAAFPISVISLVLVTAKEFHIGTILIELLKRLQSAILH